VIYPAVEGSTQHEGLKKIQTQEKPCPSPERANTGIQMKLLLAVSVAILSLVACNRKSDVSGQTEKPETQPQVTIIYDRMWSIGSATDSTFMSVPADAKLQENAFFLTFATAFQSEPACSGLSLFALDPPGGNSLSALKRLNPAAKGQWKVNVSFKPGHEKQAWSMGHMMKLVNQSGEGDAHSMAHAVCLGAKETGGQVIE
jgi:hypothetical protein